jgi:hypothetical protein
MSPTTIRNTISGYLIGESSANVSANHRQKWAAPAHSAKTAAAHGGLWQQAPD